MNLALIDWIIIALFIGISFYIGIRVKNTAGKSLSHFFLGGRNLPWYIAGVSMVATTFAADTPLAVTEIIAKNGISGNWLWWSFLIGGLLTTFFFANLWRKANILTELEFLELRYSGKFAQFLRGFKSVYLGIFLNTIIIGWVNSAMITILMIFLDIDKESAFYLTFGLMIIVAIYSAMSGLLGVAITDFLQFIIAMTGSVILAVIVVNSDSIQGISGLMGRLEPSTLKFIPDFGSDSPGQISMFALFVLLSVTWWASWFPGNEPGGGGYISQRMMSAKNEKNAVLSSLFFQFAHYALRPWPWIIVALCTLVLYPDLEKPQEGYVMIMRDFLPAGLKGLLLAAFFGAYMSTLSTHFNWGASYITNDLYKRFISPPKSEIETEEESKHYIKAARWITVIIMAIAFIFSFFIDSLKGAWEFLLASGSGLGAVLILRWYWYRINAFTEFIATLAPFVGYSISELVIKEHLISKVEYDHNQIALLFTAGFTTVCWLITVFVTKPESDLVLEKFYKRVKPAGFWGKFSNTEDRKVGKKRMINLAVCWASAIISIYSALFFIGKLILLQYEMSAVFFSTSLFFAFILRYFLKKSGILTDS